VRITKELIGILDIARPDRHPKRIAGIMVSVMITLFMAALDSTIVGTAMPKIIGDLQGMEQYSWPFTAYMLFSTLAIVIFGRLSDLYGRKFIFLFGILFFLFSSALCGLSQSMLQLIIFRGFHGIGGGIIFSSSFIIVGDLFPPRERGKYMGMLVSVFGLSSVIGPAVGGLITDHLSWRWVFYINIPLGGIACFFVVFFLPRLRAVIEHEKVDYWGAFFLLLSLLPLFLAFNWAGTRHEWSSLQILALLALSIIMFLIFFEIERKAKAPVLPLTLFKNSIFATSVAVMFLSSAVMFCGIIYIPLFAQGVLGASATNSGLVTTPMMVSLSLSAILTGGIISRTGRYKALALLSPCIAGVSLLLLSRMNTVTAMSHLLIYGVLFGIGSGVIIPSINIAVQNAFSRSNLALVTSSLQFFRNIGATVGTSVFGFVMSTTMKKGMTGIGLNNLPPQVAEVFANHRIASSGENFIQIRDHLPPSLLPLFDQLLTQVRAIMAHSLQNIFALGLVVAILTLLVTLRLKELPLRRGEATIPEEEQS
jgi:EmrB/QacA subfamily drug resistance transporter